MDSCGVSRGLPRCLAGSLAWRRAGRLSGRAQKFTDFARTGGRQMPRSRNWRSSGWSMRMSSRPNMFPVCHGKSRPFSTAGNETAWTYSMPRSLHLGHGECLNIRNVTLQVLRFGFPVLACFRFPDAIFSAWSWVYFQVIIAYFFAQGEKLVFNFKSLWSWRNWNWIQMG